jgi:hypothetical protein
MAILNESAQKTYSGNGTAGPYAIDFTVLYDNGGNAEDITVTKVTKATGALEDITATSTIAGLNVTLADAASIDYYIVLSRVPDFTQENGYEYRDAIPSKPLERSLDKLTMLCQWLKNRWEAISSQITTPVAVFIDAIGASATLTTLGFSDFIKTLVDDNDAGTAQTTLGFSAYIKTLIDAASAAAARVILGFSATSEAVNANGSIDLAGPIGIGGAHNELYFLNLTGGAKFSKGLYFSDYKSFTTSDTQNAVYDALIGYIISDLGNVRMAGGSYGVYPIFGVCGQPDLAAIYVYYVGATGLTQIAFTNGSGSTLAAALKIFV